MKLKTILLCMLITLSTLSFGYSNNIKAEETTSTSNTQQTALQPRVELVWINGVLWIIVYDADENIIQASAVGHSE